MSKKSFPTFISNGQNNLQHEIQILQLELNEILKKTQSFEMLLRSHVSDLIVESQELFILYKEIKKAKKNKRLEQKKRGKNYQEPKGLQIIHSNDKPIVATEEQKEKRRLYREAMLHVHPDKFHMSKLESEVATEVTSRLIEIYKTESLETLQAYHAHIFKGNIGIHLSKVASEVKGLVNDNYLQLEKERIIKEIASAKKQHLYTVLTEYDNPMSFITEIKDYYEDRIFKLRKRTRKGL